MRSDSARRLRLVVVGAGMTAQRLLELLVDSGDSERFEIVALGEEPEPPYDRIQLTRVIDGAEPSTLRLRERAWFESHGIRLETKNAARALDLAARVVWTERGERIGFDRLVLATGAQAFVPPCEGLELPGVFPYRALADAERIAAAARTARRAAVLGGGLLGLEAARALQRRGCRVTVVEAGPRLLPRQLDREGARVLEESACAAGLDVRIHQRLRRVQPSGPHLRLELDKGAPVDADLLVLAAGTRPRDALAREAGLFCHVAGGVLVDARLRTSHPDVFAVGDCASHHGEVSGLVAPGYAMTEVVAAGLAGRARTFHAGVAVTRLKLDALEVFAVGESLADGADVARVGWSAPGRYRRLVARRGRLVGAISVGENPDAARLQEAVARGRPLRAWQRRRFEREGSLGRRAPERPVAAWPAAAVVCACTGNTCGALQAAVASGARTRALLSQRTGAGTVCGSCVPLLEELTGERTSRTHRLSDGWLAGAALAAGLAVAAVVTAEPFALSPSAQAAGLADALWRSSGARQATGFALLAATALALLLPLRRRWTRFGLGTLLGWFRAHAVLGVLAVLLTIAHTGLRLGENLNGALMACFLVMAALGAAAGVAAAFERRLPPRVGAPLRAAVARAHLVAAWPLPVLVLFHVLAVYWF